MARFERGFWRRRAGENYEDSDSDDQLDDTAGTGTDEESGAEDSGDDIMNTERYGEEDDDLPSYSIEDPASENDNRISPQQKTTTTALSQDSVIIGVDGRKIMMAKEATSSLHDPSTLGFSRLCLLEKTKEISIHCFELSSDLR